MKQMWTEEDKSVLNIETIVGGRGRYNKVVRKSVGHSLHVGGVG